MRLIICGDTHIGAILGLGGPNGSGGNTRVDDYEETLNYIVDYTISTKADVFVQTGDVFDVRNPDPEHIAVVNRCIRKLSNAGITSIWIMGNHDYKRSGDSYTSAITSLAAKDYPNTRIVLKPEVVEISSSNSEKASILLIPFRDRRMYSGNTCQEDSLLYEAEAKALIDSCDQAHPIVAVGHNFYHEGTYHHYGGAEVLINIDAFEKCDMVAMGHYHQFKILRKNNPIAFYTGSMEKLNFGDAKIDKFFVDYNTKNKKVAVKKTPSRALVDKYINIEDADYSNLYERIEEEVQKIQVKDTIVRVKFGVKDTLASSIKKQDVQKMLYNNGAFYVSKVLMDPIHKRVNKNLEILNEKTGITMFEAFLKKQDLPDDVKADILIEAKKGNYMKRKILDPELKWFMWLADRVYDYNIGDKPAKSNKGLYPYAGPRYTGDIELIGRSNWHNESEILSMKTLSATNRKRISKIRVGTVLRIEYLNLNNYLYLKLMSNEEIKQVNDWLSLNNELDGVNEIIKETIPELLKQKNKLSAKIAKEKKRLKKEGII